MSRFIRNSEVQGQWNGTSPRAKAVEKVCLRCGTGIEKRKTYCGPCYDIRLQQNIARNRPKYKNGPVGRRKIAHSPLSQNQGK